MNPKLIADSLRQMQNELAEPGQSCTADPIVATLVLAQEVKELREALVDSFYGLCKSIDSLDLRG